MYFENCSTTSIINFDYIYWVVRIFESGSSIACAVLIFFKRFQYVWLWALTCLRPLLCTSLFSVALFCSIVIRNAGIIYCLLFLEYLVDCTKIFIKIVLFCIIAKLSNLYIIFLLLKVRNLNLFVMQLTTA